LVATGLLNFTVSFSLGLWLAMRARNLDTSGRRALVGALWREFRKNPARFLWRHESEPELVSDAADPSAAA
jgi:site-specific recombinase